jgi:pimeloyl-ACP methyl ester carboxylesterase
VALVGYCMGGLLLPPALTHPDKVSGLVCLATPWDLPSGRTRRGDRRRLAGAGADAAAGGRVAIDAIQALAAWIRQAGAVWAGLDPASLPRSSWRWRIG